MIAENYFNMLGLKKLHIGCGPTNLLNGWLNTDLIPHNDQILKLDVLNGPFPFENETFDYIFSEHMLEHIDYASGLIMLKECFRTIKKNGRIRISVPNMKSLIKVYQNPDVPLHKDWLNYQYKYYVQWAPFPDPIFVINNYVRAWGHSFIYDIPSLSASLLSAGFKSVTEHDICKSSDENLENLENPGRLPPGFLQLETLTLEAIK
jgi:predicted SAM-dependent methyltransferase